MLIPVLQMTAGLVMLFFGGETLVRGAVAFAHKCGMSALSIGLTIVAFATSAPELAVSVSAALDGASAIAVGNVVGSNIANIGLILAISALIQPMMVENKVLKVDASIMLGCVALMCVMLLDSYISRTEGVFLTAGIAGYVLFTLWDARQHPEPSNEDIDVTGASMAKPLYVDILLFLSGLAVLIGGGKILVLGAITIAEQLNISQAVIGLTIIAVGTSLPELATSVIAALRGYSSMAIGNIIGSNIFNTLGILGVTSLVQPLDAGAIGWADLGTMALISVAMMLFLVTRNLLDRKEGALLLLAYTAYTAWLAVG